MDKVLGFFSKIHNLYIVVVLSMILALLSSSGGMNLQIWFFGFVFFVFFIILTAIHVGIHRVNRISIRIALLIESIFLMVFSLLMGGDNKSFGYSDPYSVTFLGKTYLPEDASHDQIDRIINAIFTAWIFCLISILVTLFVSLLLSNVDEGQEIHPGQNEVQRQQVKTKERQMVVNFFHVIAASISMMLITSNFPKTQDPYRSGIDKGFIILGLWILFSLSAIIFVVGKQHLRYPVLMYLYQVVGVVSAMYAHEITKDLYGVRYGSDVLVLKIVSLVSIVLIVVMFLRSAFYRYKDPALLPSDSTDSSSDQV